MIAYGQLNMHPHQLPTYTLWQFWLKWQGYTAARLEVEVEEMRRLRLLLSTLYNTAGKSWKKRIKPQELIKLPGDEQGTQVFNKFTKEQLRKAFTN